MQSTISKDFPMYRVYESGRITNTKLGKDVTPVIKNGGYMQVRLSHNGKVNHKSHHRFIYETFNGRIPDGNADKPHKW